MNPGFMVIGLAFSKYICVIRPDFRCMKSTTLLVLAMLPALGILALVASTPVVASSPPPCVWGFTSAPTAQVVPAASTNSYGYVLSWTSLPNPSSITFTTTVLTPTSAGWSASVTSTNPVSVTSTSGSTTVTVQVVASATSGSSATIQVTATDGTCTAQGTQYITTSFATSSSPPPPTVPEFPLGIIGAVGVSMLFLALLRRELLAPRLGRVTE